MSAVGNCDIDQQCRRHEVSILIACGTGVGRCLGCCSRRKVSMMSMRAPQHGQGRCGDFGSSSLALAALRHCEHLADACDVVGADGGGEQAVIAAAVEAGRQDVH